MTDKQTVIVTGASGNLGAASALALAEAGFSLALVDREAAGLESLRDRLPKNAEVLLLPGIDLTDQAAAEKMAAETVHHFGGITGLVNTVGGFQMGPVVGEALSQFDLMMKLNGRVTLITSAAVLPAMVKGGYGRIVHIAAQPGLKAAAGQAAYAASKAAVIRIVESIAAEHRKDRITANCILPSTIDTPQNRAAMPDAKTDSWVRLEAIAKLIVFLMSPESAVVTGGAIPATGQE